jgi:hypothetical protein
MSTTIRQLLILSFFAGGLVLLWQAGRGRRDRQWGRTAWIVAAAELLLAFGTAGVGWWQISLGLMGLLVLGGAVTGILVEVRNRRERGSLVDSAIAAGIPPKEARRMYRRQLSSPYAVLGWWILGLVIVLFAFVAVLLLVDAPLTVLEEPKWSWPAVLPGPAAPWWIWVILVVDFIAVVHMMINACRISGPDRAPGSRKGCAPMCDSQR